MITDTQMVVYHDKGLEYVGGTSEVFGKIRYGKRTYIFLFVIFLCYNRRKRENYDN